MNRAVAGRLTWFIAGLGVLTAAGAFALFGIGAAQSVAIGAAMGLANWLVLRFVVGRVLSGSVRSRTGFAFVLVIKMGALMALSFLLIAGRLVQPIAFTVGLSALVVGALLGAFVHILTAAPAESEG